MCIDVHFVPYGTRYLSGMRSARLLQLFMLPSALVVLSACGGAVERPAPTSNTVGWHDVTPAPPRGRGTLVLSSSGRTGTATLSVTADDAPPRALSVFAWFAGDLEPRPLVALPAGTQAATFSVTDAACGRKANLIAVEASSPIADWRSTAFGSIVGVSRRGRELFPLGWDFDVELPCTNGEHPMPPLRLEDDRRLPLALCGEKTGSVRCGLDVLPEVRVREAQATVSADGLEVVLVPEYVPPGETPVVRVDGELAEGLSFRRPNGTFDRPLAITVAIGARPPFHATLIAPTAPLDLALGRLRAKEELVATTTGQPWASQWVLDIVPTSMSKEAFTLSASAPRVQGIFPGFHAPDATARARMSVTSSRSGFWVERVEERTVPIE